MTDPIWTGAVSLRWKGDELLCGTVEMGIVIGRENGWEVASDVDAVDYNLGGVELHPTEAAARDAMVDAVVRAMTTQP